MERVDERLTPLWSESKNKEHAVGRDEDSISSKLKKVENRGYEAKKRDILSPEGIDKPGAVEDLA